MKILTSGSRLDIPAEIMQNFDGIVAGYLWNLWDSPNPNEIAKKYGKTLIRSHFLYGNQHQKPDPASKTTTIVEWIERRLRNAAYVNEWVLVNEFLNDKDNYNPYLGYDYENLKRYYLTANKVNPNAQLLIGDFRCHQIKRWEKIAFICRELIRENVPLHGVGIQVHFKTSNAYSLIPGVPYVLDALPTVIKLFEGILPVHLIEVSCWHHYSESPEKITPLWDKLLRIAEDHNVASICPWWLNETDEGHPRSMPTFEEFKGAGVYDKNWNLRLKLPNINSDI